MKNDKEIVAVSIAVTGLFILGVIGLTYAFVIANVEGNPEATQSILETADLRLVFNDTQVIEMNGVLPGENQTKTFTISNIGNRKINYDINITNVKKTFKNNELVYSLTSTNDGASITKETLPSVNRTLVSGIIEPGVTQTYTMTILFKETGQNQNANQGAVFAGKLQINAQSAYSDEVVFSIEKTIGTSLIGETKKINLLGNYYGTVNCISEDETIAECIPSQNEISILGKALGTTNITVTEDNKNIETTYTIIVKEFTENAPLFVEGMTPVKWIGEPGNYTEVETTADDPEWYDYSQKKWANGKTADGSYWVWIPRYAYKITSGYHTSNAGTIDIKFVIDKTLNTPDGTIIELNGYDADTKNTSMHYFLHPAFQNNITNGGWDSTLTGIWVAKFEASVADQSDLCYTSPDVSTCNKTTLLPAFKPNVTSWRFINNSNIYDLVYNMRFTTYYGWQRIDSHMMKNTEWGAVLYLAQSEYGANQEIRKNNSSTFTTGCAGNSMTENSYSGCQNAYDTPNGEKASTTHNITGIYDMSGGAYEKTTGYVNNDDPSLATNGLPIINEAPKYKNVYNVGAEDTCNGNYEANKNKYGDALYETSGSGMGSTAWNSKYSYMPFYNSPWFTRGGIFYSGSAFEFNMIDGSSTPDHGFRVVLASYG